MGKELTCLHQVRVRFQRKLQDAIDSLPSGRRLAAGISASVSPHIRAPTSAKVHIRRSDKACEAAANFELSDEGLKQRIIQQPDSQLRLQVGQVGV